MGKVMGIKNNFVELLTAKGDPVYLNLQHIKTVHMT
jgi:hypothetical protein